MYINPILKITYKIIVNTNVTITSVLLATPFEPKNTFCTQFINPPTIDSIPLAITIVVGVLLKQKNNLTPNNSINIKKNGDIMKE